MKEEIDTTNETFFSNDEIKKIYLEEYKKGFQEFSKVLDSFFQSFSQEDPFWWVSNTVSRDPKRSSLYKNFCIILTLLKLKNIGYRPTKIITNSIAMKELIREIYGDHITEVCLNLTKENKTSKIISFLRKANFLFCKLLQILLIKLFIKKITTSKKDYLFETFISFNSLENRYYPKIENFVDQENQKYITFLPIVIETRFYQLLHLINELKRSDKKYFFREHYLKISDLIRSVFYKNKFKGQGKVFSSSHNLNFYFLIKESIKEEEFNSLSAEGIINYSFVKNFGTSKKRKEFPSVFVDWWENTPMDRGFSIGINNYLNEVNHKAYVGFFPNLLSNQLSPSKVEVSLGVCPKQVGVIGKYLYDHIRQINKEINIFLAPGFRFSYLDLQAKPTEQSSKERNNLLVLLPIYIEDSVNILNLLTKINNFISLNEVAIKPHPGSDFDAILKASDLNLESNFYITDNQVEDLILSSSFVISGRSSAVIEAICLLKPVMVYNPDLFNPIRLLPELFENELLCYFTYFEDIKQRVNFFSNKKSNTSFNKEIYNMDYFFTKPNDSNVSSLINN
ncbi:MAG: hypothetical protein CMD90_03440 [Gammaproteobacteria bacterium]|nr:hypothetical protein [Gammaproteobacteria bacterium]